MTFLNNAWYMLAWSDEIPADGFLTRRILDLPIAAYRRQDGTAIALHDRCPHRFAPLSRGTMVDDKVRCGYHGLTFDEQGQCLKSLFSEAVPRAARVRAFPLEETGSAIWIWMGASDLVDPASVPHIAHHSDPALRFVKGVTHAQADYRLLSDNLMDLSHTATLHPAFGGLDYLPKCRSWEDADGSIVSDHFVESIPNFLGPMIPHERVSHRDTIRWIAPSVHVLDSTTSAPGDDTLSVWQPSAHILTPATARSTHYFWSAAVPIDSPHPDEELETILRFAFDEEDKPMVEAVQDRMEGAELWDLNPVLLPADAGAVRMRRKLAALIAAETPSAGDPSSEVA
jgi:vanillate O-demethylase monooxygenase subunit